MTVKDVIELLFAARERIDFYWNFYVVIGIAVVGWLVTLKKSLTLPMKILVSLVYVIASTMNFLGLYSSYTFAEGLRTDLLNMIDPASLADTRLILEQHSYLTQRMAALTIHLAVGATILFVIWFARFTEPEEAATKAPTSTTRAGRAGEQRNRTSS
jgi:hypothetical protein